jgi:hypothetical protein
VGEEAPKKTRENADWRYAYFMTLYSTLKIISATEFICTEQIAEEKDGKCSRRPQTS